MARPVQLSSPSTARPFVKWAGGKRKVVPQLLRNVPQRFNRYHEPFVGAGALFFALASDRRLREGGVLSDMNRRLVRTWRAVRDDVEGVIAHLERHAEANSKEHYYRVRAWDVDDLDDDAEVAGWFIYLNKAGFNGLYRVNSKNRFNVPYGRNPRATICDADNLRACSAALRDVQVNHEDFSAVADRARPGDLVYFDPPYVPLTSTAYFTAYTKDGFGPDDQRRLAEVATELAGRGVTVILSNHDTEGLRDLYGDRFRVRTIQVPRAINSRGDRRGTVREVIIASEPA